MTEREKHIEMAQRLGLVGMRPHLDGIYIDALAAFAKLVADDARATPALPQGVEEWVAQHSHQAHVYDYDTQCVMTLALQCYLSGMAIVPVEPTRAMCKAATSYTHSHDAMLIYKAMHAAAKEKGDV